MIDPVDKIFAIVMTIEIIPLFILNLIEQPLRKSLERFASVLALITIPTIPSWGMAHVITGH
jgi:hypothetical protein